MRDSMRGTISTRFLKRTWSKFPLLGFTPEEEERCWSCESHELESTKLPFSCRSMKCCCCCCDSNMFLVERSEKPRKLGFGRRGTAGTGTEKTRELVFTWYFPDLNFHLLLLRAELFFPFWVRFKTRVEMTLAFAVIYLFTTNSTKPNRIGHLLFSSFPTRCCFCSRIAGYTLPSNDIGTIRLLSNPLSTYLWVF